MSKRSGSLKDLTDRIEASNPAYLNLFTAENDADTGTKMDGNFVAHGVIEDRGLGHGKLVTHHGADFVEASSDLVSIHGSDLLIDGLRAG